MPSFPEGGWSSVEVTSPVKSEGNILTAHVTYGIATTDAKNNRTSATRRYNDFQWLWDRLSEAHPDCLVPPLPSKGLFGRFAEEFISERMRSLQRFLTRLTQHEVLSKNESVVLFLLGSDEELVAAQKETPKISVKGFAKFFKGGVQAMSNLVSKGSERERNETDEKADEMLAQSNALEYALGALVDNTDKIVEKEKECSKTFGELAKSCETAAKCDAECDKDLAQLFDQLARMYDQLRGLGEQKQIPINEAFKEGLKDQQSMAGAVKKMLKTRAEASDELHNAKQALGKLQESQRVLQAEVGKEEKLASVTQLVTEAESAVAKAKEELERITTRCFADFVIARKEREATLASATVALAEAHIKHAKDALDVWDAVLPAARELASKFA